MTRLVVSLFAAVLASGCSDDGAPGGSDAPPGDDALTIDAPATDAAPIDAPPTGFTLTSATVTAGGSIPGIHTCTGPNTSPALAWVNPPAGTMSYALVLTDLTSSGIQWVIYDIPAAITALPEDVDKVYAPPDVAGAHQTTSFRNVRGYVGPCPAQPEEHEYQFAVFALDTAMLPGASMATTQVEALQAINQHRIGRALLMARHKQ